MEKLVWFHKRSVLWFGRLPHPGPYGIHMDTFGPCGPTGRRGQWAVGSASKTPFLPAISNPFSHCFKNSLGDCFFVLEQRIRRLEEDTSGVRRVISSG